MSELKGLLDQLELTEDNRLMLGEVAVIMMPAWFFSGILKRVKEQAGVETAKKVYYEAGWEGAYNWSKVQLDKGLKGREVMAQYLGSMTVRGWGRFEIVEFDQTAGTGLFRYYNSAVALQQGNVGEAICYWVPGALAGAMKAIMEAEGKETGVRGREVGCLAQGREFCEFVVEPEG